MCLMPKKNERSLACCHKRKEKQCGFNIFIVPCFRAISAWFISSEIASRVHCSIWVVVSVKVGPERRRSAGAGFLFPHQAVVLSCEDGAIVEIRLVLLASP